MPVIHMRVSPKVIDQNDDLAVGSVVVLKWNVES